MMPIAYISGFFCWTFYNPSLSADLEQTQFHTVLYITFSNKQFRRWCKISRINVTTLTSLWFLWKIHCSFYAITDNLHLFSLLDSLFFMLFSTFCFLTLFSCHCFSVWNIYTVLIFLCLAIKGLKANLWGYVLRRQMYDSWQGFRQGQKTNEYFTNAFD